MLSFNDDQSLLYTSDVDISNVTFHSSPQKLTASTPQSAYKPRVNFRSIESLASSDSPILPHTVSYAKQNDTGLHSFNSPTFNSHEHEPQSYATARKSRRKLSDWQIWYLNQVYSQNRYPAPHEQEEIARQLLLPVSSIRIWFQNHRARCGKK